MGQVPAIVNAFLNGSLEREQRDREELEERERRISERTQRLGAVGKASYEAGSMAYAAARSVSGSWGFSVRDLPSFALQS
jgi:hypothetical protein